MVLSFAGVFNVLSVNGDQVGVIVDTTYDFTCRNSWNNRVSSISLNVGQVSVIGILILVVGRVQDEDIMQGR